MQAISDFVATSMNASIRFAKANWFLVGAYLVLASITSVGFDARSYNTGWAVLWSFACIVPLVMLAWIITRKMAPADRRGVGSVGAWIGWSALSILPVLPWIVASVILEEKIGALANSSVWWVDALITSLFLAFGIPWLVYSAGRAINSNDELFPVFWHRSRRNYSIMFGAYFLFSAPVYLLGNLATRIGFSTETWSFADLVVSSTLYFAAAVFSVLALALTVHLYLAFSQASAERPKEAVAD